MKTEGQKIHRRQWAHNGGIKTALEKAKENAGGKDIRIQGGANVIRQYLNAGLVDEFTIHVAPVMIGSGIRLFEQIDRMRFSLEIFHSTGSQWVTHITYKISNH